MKMMAPDAIRLLLFPALMAASAIDNRFEMVIVKRSLDAAKAISAGKRSNLIASAAIVCIPAHGPGNRED